MTREIREPVDNTITESEAMTWLQAVDSLTAEDLDIHDSEVLSQFKNILLLHTHELFYDRQLWRAQHKDFIFPLITKIIKNSIKRSAFSHLVASSSEEALWESVLAILEPQLNIIQRKLTALADIEAELYMPLDVILQPGIIEHCMDKLKEELAEALFRILRHSSKLGLDSILESVWGEVEKCLFHQSMQNIAALMTIDADKITQLSRINAKDACASHQLGQYQYKISALHKQYINYNEKHLQRVAKTQSRCSKYIPTMTAADFIRHYQNALAAITRTQNLARILNNFVYEVYLQHLRYPQNSPVVEKILAVCMDLSNSLLPLPQETITHNSLVTRAIAEVNPPLSLQEKLQNALLKLKPFSGGSELSTLQYDAAGRIPAPLWNRMRNNELYNQECLHLFAVLDISDTDDMQATAKIYFSLQLMMAKNIEQIASLVRIATPFLKPHAPLSWYATDNLPEAIETASRFGLTILKEETSELSQSSPKKAAEFCRAWRNNSLFSHPRSRPQQKEIDNLVRTLLTVPTPR
jgi:hypothetical protein